MELRHVFTVPGTPERAGDLMSDEGYTMSGERTREGVVSAQYKVVERTADRLAYEIRAVERKRSLTGGFDTATVETCNRSVWDRRARTLAWTYEGQERRLRIGGVYRFEPAPEGVRVEHVISIEANIPLIGGQVAKLVAHGFQKTWPETESRLREALGRPPTA